MLQIARVMEYLHSRKIYHGDLNPSNVLVRTRHGDAHLHVKVAGFGQPAISATVATNPCIWYAPEVWSGRRPSAPRRRTCTALRC